MLSAAVTWRTRVVGAVTWRACVVGGCDVAYAGPFSGDVAVRWQRATQRRDLGSDVAFFCPHPSTRGGAHAAVGDECALAICKGRRRRRQRGDVGWWW